jgi:hypothetical protein
MVAAIAGAAILLTGGEETVSEPDEISASEDDRPGSTEADTDEGSESDDDDRDADPSPVTTDVPVTAAPTTTAAPSLGLARIDPAWISIINSLDVNVFTFDQAVAQARDLSSRGIPADVLFSSSYGSMRPGYWVVYSGVFGGRDPASDLCVSIQPQISTTCYPREANGYRAVNPPA